jgi:hypothetical protein
MADVLHVARERYFFYKSSKNIFYFFSQKSPVRSHNLIQWFPKEPFLPESDFFGAFIFTIFLPEKRRFGSACL